MQWNIPEERKHLTEAAFVVKPFWQFHIEGLHVTCSGGANSVNKQTENCITGNVADRFDPTN